jgi:hypothetical protein
MKTITLVMKYAIWIILISIVGYYAYRFYVREGLDTPTIAIIVIIVSACVILPLMFLYYSKYGNKENSSENSSENAPQTGGKNKKHKQHRK